ncbi:MAG: hypothetical protein K2N87_08995 [Eubacterium sp.]|nr:hypothetical protein [Eubacterium sp.]
MSGILHCILTAISIVIAVEISIEISVIISVIISSIAKQIRRIKHPIQIKVIQSKAPHLYSDFGLIYFHFFSPSVSEPQAALSRGYNKLYA